MAGVTNYLDQVELASWCFVLLPTGLVKVAEMQSAPILESVIVMAICTCTVTERNKVTPSTPNALWTS